MGAPLIGIDLLEPARLEQRLQETAGLSAELFTDQEIAYCDGQTSPYEHLCARFCAKEATSKALGMDGFDPLDIEVLGGGESARLALYRSAKARADELEVEVTMSLTHLPGIAGAVVLALPRRIWHQAARGSSRKSKP